MNNRKRRIGAVAAALIVGAASLSACTSGDSTNAQSGKTLTVWTADTLPDRVAKTHAILDKFTASTGINVKLVGVPEDQFNQVLTSSAASGTLPDVIGSISLAQVRTLSANDLTDTAANKAVVQDLGENTWTQRALDLTRSGDDQLAVPSEFWAQLLYYRKDLFKAAGIPEPKTYDDVLAAAKALDSSKMAGFVGATKPGTAFTQQTFQQIALGNNCQMVDDAGKVVFDSPECVKALEFYANLIKNYSVPGAQDVDTTRATYFAGKSAMFIWSTFVLDEMAGLRNDAKPTCPQCIDDPAFLAKNTGVVSSIQGPDSKQPGQFGEVTSWDITAGSQTDAAKKFVEYMMGDGYVDWLAIAPEGKVPVHQGTAAEPTKYSDAWASLPVGVDTKAPLSKFYSSDVLTALKKGPAALNPWGIAQGQGKLLGASLGELPIAKAVSEVTTGGVDAQTAAKEAADALRSIQSSLK